MVPIAGFSKRPCNHSIAIAVLFLRSLNAGPLPILLDRGQIQGSECIPEILFLLKLEGINSLPNI